MFSKDFLEEVSLREAMKNEVGWVQGTVEGKPLQRGDTTTQEQTSFMAVSSTRITKKLFRRVGGMELEKHRVEFEDTSLRG